MSKNGAVGTVVIWMALGAAEAGYIGWRWGLFILSDSDRQHRDLPGLDVLQAFVGGTAVLLLVTAAGLIGLIRGRSWSRPLLVATLLLSVLWSFGRLMVEVWVHEPTDKFLLLGLIVLALIAVAAVIAAPPHDLDVDADRSY